MATGVVPFSLRHFHPTPPGPLRAASPRAAAAAPSLARSGRSRASPFGSSSAGGFVFGTGASWTPGLWHILGSSVCGRGDFFLGGKEFWGGGGGGGSFSGRRLTYFLNDLVKKEKKKRSRLCAFDTEMVFPKGLKSRNSGSKLT